MTDKAALVRELIKKHFWEMSDDTSVSTGKQSVLPEDMTDFLEEYSESLNVNMSDFVFNRYFPNEGIRFLPNRYCPAILEPIIMRPSL